MQDQLILRASILPVAAQHKEAEKHEEGRCAAQLPSRSQISARLGLKPSPLPLFLHFISKYDLLPFSKTLTSSFEGFPGLSRGQTLSYWNYCQNILNVQRRNKKGEKRAGRADWQKQDAHLQNSNLDSSLMLTELTNNFANHFRHFYFQIVLQG